MKNRELIERLLEYNWDADVSLTTSEDIYLSYICEDGEDERTTKQIFIEGCDKE